MVKSARKDEPFSLDPVGNSTMGFVLKVREGLPLKSLAQLSAHVAPDDSSFKYRIVKKATYARRKHTGEPLSQLESEVVVRISRLWSFGLEIFDDEDATRTFFTLPHPMLAGESPLDVALSGEAGARLVENILGRLLYGSAA